MIHLRFTLKQFFLCFSLPATFFVCGTSSAQEITPDKLSITNKAIDLLEDYCSLHGQTYEEAIGYALYTGVRPLSLPDSIMLMGQGISPEYNSWLIETEGKSYILHITREGHIAPDSYLRNIGPRELALMNKVEDGWLFPATNSKGTYRCSIAYTMEGSDDTPNLVSAFQNVEIGNDTITNSGPVKSSEKPLVEQSRKEYSLTINTSEIDVRYVVEYENSEGAVIWPNRKVTRLTFLR